MLYYPVIFFYLKKMSTFSVPLRFKTLQSSECYLFKLPGKQSLLEEVSLSHSPVKFHNFALFYESLTPQLLINN